MMASSATMENNFECPSKKDVYRIWQESAPKIKFGEHELNIELEGIGEFFMQKAKEELRETPEIIAESCTQLTELIAGEPDLKVPNDEEFYKMFLRPCKYYPKSAFSLMKRYYRFRLNYPHIYADLLPSKEKTAFCANLIYPLPFRAKDGSRILIIEGGKRWNPKEVSLNTLLRGLIIMLYMAVAEPKNQEKIRKRIHFHGTNWESLMIYIDQKALLKRHGGELDMPEGPFGMTLWESILLCESFFEVDQQYGYKTDNNIK
ncbi:uncharacterized protein LOC115245383 isoform X2 [Formica exsecta]|uniref:uncharacterized protein LOC115245383 isoform X2 n=1 Tax=Formica exsecta TaxID=72781 RepID=UPI0011430068|nr:uncharacterized protein LOC115245383 isoform X2 [Formica exsecta]